MANKLSDVVRVRDVRVRLAQNEASRLLKVTAGAQAAVEEARLIQVQHAAKAAQATALATGEARDGGEARFLASEVLGLLDFAAGARFKAREAAALIRRAELVHRRAKEESDAAQMEYRRQAARQETISDQWDRRKRIALRKKTDREEEYVTEELTTCAPRGTLDGST